MYRIYRYHRPRGIIGKFAPRTRVRLGNVDDSINTPGFPGSSTMYGRLGYAGAPTTAAVVAAAPAVVTPWYQKLVSALAPTATAAISVYQQSQFAKMNRERLRAGHPPISPELYRQYIGPAATAEVGLAPATRNMLLIGGLGLAALLVLPRLLRR